MRYLTELNSSYSTIRLCVCLLACVFHLHLAQQDPYPSWVCRKRLAVDVIASAAIAQCSSGRVLLK